MDSELHPLEIDVGNLQQPDFCRAEAVPVRREQQRIIPDTLAFSKAKNPAKLVGGMKLDLFNAVVAHHIRPKT